VTLHPNPPLEAFWGSEKIINGGSAACRQRVGSVTLHPNPPLEAFWAQKKEPAQNSCYE